MAEFQEVARHWKRMCEVYWTPNSCHGCPLAEHEQAYEACSAADIDVASMEEIVMSWAAENPEPVYPSWKEWLISMGVVKEQEIGETVELPDGSVIETNKEMYTLVKWDEQIPADVAQRLGVEPKNDQR